MENLKKITINNSDLDLIKKALQSHINQCERLKEPLQNSELQYVNNKIINMKRLLKEL